MYTCINKMYTYTNEVSVFAERLLERELDFTASLYTCIYMYKPYILNPRYTCVHIVYICVYIYPKKKMYTCTKQVAFKDSFACNMCTYSIYMCVYIPQKKNVCKKKCTCTKQVAFKDSFAERLLENEFTKKKMYTCTKKKNEYVYKTGRFQR